MDVLSLGVTKQTILVLLLDGDATAEDLALRLGMNLSVARRHLDDLGASKLVEFSFRRTGKGRPSKYYSISLEGRNRISAKYDVMADLLTMAMTKDMGPEKAKDLFESAAHIFAASVGKHQSLDSLLPVLSDFGFQPKLRKEGGRDLIVSRNCPILKLAMKYPELTCDSFHTSFCREVLDNPQVVLRQAISRGAKECIHEA